MLLTERHIISPNHSFYEECDRLCLLSKNLYNAGLYAVRQHFFSTGGYLGYHALQKQFQKSRQIDYYQLPAKVSQQVLMVLDRNFKSFFNALKAYSKNPSRFKGKPKIPRYKHKTKGRNLLTYTAQAVSKPFLSSGWVKPSKTNLKITTTQKKVQQVRIVPQATCYVVEVVYDMPVKPQSGSKNTVAGIDIGLNNLMAVTYNRAGLAPFLVNGRPLKSINQFYNKKKAELQSRLPKGAYGSKRIQKLTFKRNMKVADYMHKASRQVVDELVKNGIGLLVIGKNDGWKDSINIGKKNNQGFVSVPHARLIEMLKYKAELAGIRVELTEESYTSKCSFLDGESIGKKEKYAGRRVKRGLFKTAGGRLVNADMNGSLNIIRKVVPKAFAKGIEAVVVQPYRYSSIK